MEYIKKNYIVIYNIRYTRKLISRMGKYMQIIGNIIHNVLEALYQPFWAAVLMVFISMFVYLYAKEH